MSNGHIHNNVKRRSLLKHFRDQMVNHSQASDLSAVIVFLNEEIDKETDRLTEEIKAGRATMRDVFLLLDYEVTQ